MFDPKHIYPRGQEKYLKGHIMMHLKNKNLLPWVKKKYVEGKTFKKNDYVKGKTMKTKPC